MPETTDIDKLVEDFFNIILDAFININSLTNRVEDKSIKNRYQIVKKLEAKIKSSDRWKEIKDPEMKREAMLQLYGFTAKWKAELEIDQLD